jgi:hypothetical protein
VSVWCPQRIDRGAFDSASPRSPLDGARPSPSPRSSRSTSAILRFFPTIKSLVPVGHAPGHGSGLDRILVLRVIRGIELVGIGERLGPIQYRSGLLNSTIGSPS